MEKGEYMDLSSLVAANLIKPLVLLSSSVSGNVFNAYTAGVVSGNYSHLIAMFMTNKGCNITGCQFESTQNFKGGDGWMAGMTDIDNFRITYV